MTRGLCPRPPTRVYVHHVELFVRDVYFIIRWFFIVDGVGSCLAMNVWLLVDTD